MDFTQTKRFKRCGPAVQARLRRLNPNYKEGDRLRGWHPAHSARFMRVLHGVMGKRLFIAAFGRAKWNELAANPYYIIKHGKRAYMRYVAIEDHCQSPAHKKE